VSARFAVHVQPRAKRTEVTGMHGAAVKIRLAAPPVDGAANDALRRFLAERLCVPHASVHVVAGLSSRDKLIEVDSLSADDARRALLTPPTGG